MNQRDRVSSDLKVAIASKDRESVLAALRLISQRVRRETKELLKRAGARPKHWSKS